jgi:diguanylate cyclase (GGDEF)-like protein
MFDYESLKKINVLYVEDDKDVSEITAQYLSEVCKEVYVGANGEEGLELYNSKNPDVIVTDISMPIMSGLEMVQKIREKDQDTPIIINSAFSDIELFLESIRSGVSDYILKPTEPLKMIESIYKNSKYLLTNKLLKLHKKLMQGMFNEINDPIIVLEKDDKVYFKNDSAKNFLEAHDITEDEFSNVLLKDGKEYKTLYEKEDKNGNIHYFEVVVKSISGEDEDMFFILKILHDVTEYKLLEQKLRNNNDELDKLANYDSLTELPNRFFLLDKIENLIKESKEFAIFFIDLDNFKYVNDTYGHSVGDKLLVNVVKRIRNILREEDILGRLGGDEFCILFDGISDKAILSKIAQKINDGLSNELLIEEHKIYSQCSIGIALYPRDGTTLEALLKNSDTAMYVAKASDTQKFIFYETYMNNKNREILQLKSDLIEAIKKEELEVYFQPQVDFFKNVIVGLEALVRWNHPKLGLQAPIAFLPLAKSIGLLHSIDRFVMRESIKFISQHKDKNITMAINVTAQDLDFDDFLDYFRNTLEEFSCDASLIEIELIEDELISDIEKATPILKELKKIGAKIVIDDFGVGYSSLKYLKDLDVDKIKIDKSFMDNIENQNSSLIVKAIISLSNSLKLRIIAEGVEEEKQVKFLEKNNCHQIQGYIYSKPLPQKEIIKFIDNFNKN